MAQSRPISRSAHTGDDDGQLLIVGDHVDRRHVRQRHQRQGAAAVLHRPPTAEGFHLVRGDTLDAQHHVQRDGAQLVRRVVEEQQGVLIEPALLFRLRLPDAGGFGGRLEIRLFRQPGDVEG